MITLSLLSQGPCHVELQRALEKIARSQQKLEEKLTKFYLPNCDKQGLYKAKQVSTEADKDDSRFNSNISDGCNGLTVTYKP